MSHLLGLPGIGEALGATVTGIGIEHLDDLDILLAVDSSDNEIHFDSGLDESENDPNGAGENIGLSEKGQSGFNTIFVLDDIDTKGNIGSNYIVRAIDYRPKCSLM